MTDHDSTDGGSSEGPIREAEAALDRAEDLDDEAARRVLEAAREDLREFRTQESGGVDAGTCDADRLDDLERRLDQRLRAVGERDAYDGADGAALDPDAEDAP